MGNQPSRADNASLDHSAINESNTNIPLQVSKLKKKRGMSETDSSYRKSDYADAYKMAGSNNWEALCQLFRENPGHAAYKDSKYNHGLPLHRALLKLASFDFIELLIELYPQALNESDDNGMKPLHYACLYNYCMEKHFNTLRDDRDNTSWGYVLKLLIQKAPNVLKETDSEGRTPLHLAASSAKTTPKALTLLLNEYPDAVARRTKQGRLPLHFLADAKGVTFEAIKVLVDAYPKGVGESSQRRNPLHLACGETRASADIVKLLLEAYPEGVKEKSSTESMLPLHLAAANKLPLEVIQMLADAYPEAVTDRDRHARLPLHHALEKSASDDVVLYLLDLDTATSKAVGYYPHLPLHLAVEKNHSEDVIIALIVAYAKEQGGRGGSAGEKDMFGVYPLRRALKARAAEGVIIALLRDFPDGAMDVDEYERLAIHYAAGRKMSFDVIQALVRACPGAVAVPDKNGQLPLHLSVMRAADPEVIELLLKTYPEAVMVPDAYNFLPLHHAIELDVPLDLLKLLLKTNPECAKCALTGDGGKLPLHFCVEMRRPMPVIRALVEAYPGACHTRELERGRLPLCWGMERQLPLEALLLLESHYKVAECATVKDNDGRLPIHYAVENDSPIEIVQLLLDAHPTCVREEDLPFYFYTHRGGEEEFKVTGRRLDAAVHEHHAAQLRDQYNGDDNNDPNGNSVDDEGDMMPRVQRIRLYNDSIKLSNDRTIPPARPEAALDQGLQLTHNASKLPASMLKKADNHGAVEKRVVQDPKSVSVAWDKEFQRLRPLTKRPNKRLVHYATEDMHASPEIVAAILALTMPISEGTGKANLHHGYGWTYLLSDTQDHYVKTVDLLLDRYSSNMAFVQLLCDAPDELGRLACEVATPMSLKAIMARLHYFGRYQLDPGPALHLSSQSTVRFAFDHDHLMAGKAGNQATTEGLPKEKLKVAIKFMKHRDQFERETQLRSSIKFSADFVVPLTSSHDGDADPRYRKETLSKGYGDYPYLIALAAADRDLQATILHENFAGRDMETVRTISGQMLRALSHVHSLGVIHGDIKPLNVVRHKNVFKLIDLGAATRFKDFAGKGKVSTAYAPPEMIFRKTVGFGGGKKGGSSGDDDNNDEEGEGDGDGQGGDPDSTNNSSNPYFSTLEPKEYTLSSKTGMAIYAKEEEGGKDEDDQHQHQQHKQHSKPKAKPKQDPRVDPLPADASMDMWSFGVVLYLMATGENLLPGVDLDDNVDVTTERRVLLPWSDSYREQRLGKVKDHWVRNLIFQCLSKDPRRRPSAEDALCHPFFTGVSDEIMNFYRMPGQPCKFDVCLCYRKPLTDSERFTRREKRIAELIQGALDAKEAKKAQARAIAEAEGSRSWEMPETLTEEEQEAQRRKIESEIKEEDIMDPGFAAREAHEDAETLEAVARLETRLLQQGLTVVRCSVDGKELLHAHSAVLMLSRFSINNADDPTRQVLSLEPHSEFDSYFFELRLAMELRAQSYLEGGIASVLVGDKEPAPERRERLMRERAKALDKRAVDREEERKRMVADEKAAARKAYAEKRRGNRAAKSKSPTRGRKEEDPLKEAERFRLERQREVEEQYAKEDREEEQAHSVAMESEDTCYLPYYAQHMGQVMGKYGGSHPLGNLCELPVATVEKQLRTFLQSFFLGRVPVLNSNLACSPHGIIHDAVACENVMVVGEQDEAWRLASNQVSAFVRPPVAVEENHDDPFGFGAEGGDGDEDGGDDVELNQAKAEAIARKLKEQLALKESEIKLIEQSAEMARVEMQKAVDKLHKIHTRYSIY